MQKNEAIKRNTDLVSWLAAISVCFQYICAIIAVNKISVLLASGIIVACIILLWRQTLILPFQYLVCVFVIMVVFTVSFVYVQDSTYTMDYFLRFVLFCMSAFLIGFQHFDTNEVIKKIVIIGIIFTPFLAHANMLAMDSGKRMGYAYACLPILIASFISLEYGKIYFSFSIVNICVILFRYVEFAPRGIWIIVISAILMLFFWRVTYANERIETCCRISMVLVLGGGGIICCLYNLETLILKMDNFVVSKFNIKIYALDKYIRYLAKNDLLNGRDMLWKMADDLIKKNPITGYGIGSFESLTNGSYCHNIFAQTFCEAGLIFSIPTLFFIIRLIIKIVKGPYYGVKSDFVWYVFSFCCGVEILFFSSVYWIYTSFWFFWGAFITKTDRIRID